MCPICKKIPICHNWAQGVGIIYGAFSRRYPNFVLPGGPQAAGTVNIVHAMDVMAMHVANVIAQATESTSCGEQGQIVIEPPADAEEAWSL